MAAYNSEMMRRMLSRGFEPEPAAAPIHEAIIARLNLAFAQHRAPNPFKPGDLIIGRKGTSIMEASCRKPALVLESLDSNRYSFDGDPSNTMYGYRFNIRILSYQEHIDGIVAMWSDSAEWELYDPSVHNAPVKA